MPHLLIRGISPEQVRSISRPLVEELAAVCDCPEDYIMLECLHTTAVFGGEIVASYPFVEVGWFDRGREVRDRAAACIDRHIRSLGLAEAEVAFRQYEKLNYYANGKSFADEADAEPAAGTGELEALRAENRKLKEELQRARKTAAQSQASGSGSRMSSKLYDALRE